MPPPFTVEKYEAEIDRLEHAYAENIDTFWNMVSTAKFSLTRRFFETTATRVKHVYDIANRDLQGWLRSVMTPLERQVGEHHLQLRRRLESVKRIHHASGQLEERIAELDQQSEELAALVATLERAVGVIDGIVDEPESLPAPGSAVPGLPTPPLQRLSSAPSVLRT